MTRIISVQNQNGTCRETNDNVFSVVKKNVFNSGYIVVINFICCISALNFDIDEVMKIYFNSHWPEDLGTVKI